jgi:hypothetical protein
MTSSLTILTPGQIRWLRSTDYAMGPWTTDDANDPETLDAIADDIHLFIGLGHDEDVAWVTPQVISTYILHHRSMNHRKVTR